jgi:hypothetical protein
MIRRLAAFVSHLIRPHDLPQVQLIHQVTKEIGQVVMRKPVAKRRRQKQALVRIVGLEAAAHLKLLSVGLPAFYQALQAPFPDRLLGAWELWDLGHKEVLPPLVGALAELLPTFLVKTNLARKPDPRIVWRFRGMMKEPRTAPEAALLLKYVRDNVE